MATAVTLAAAVATAVTLAAPATATVTLAAPATAAVPPAAPLTAAVAFEQPQLHCVRAQIKCLLMLALSYQCQQIALVRGLT